MSRRPPADLNIVAAFYSRWAPHEDKRREIADDHKAMFAEAKSEGLNPKALRKAFAEQYRVENQTADQAEKRNETDGDVELYLSALARVREDEPEHDADGVIIEPSGAMVAADANIGGKHETAVRSDPSVNIPGRRHLSESGAHDGHAVETGELQRQPLTATHNEPAEGSAEETSATYSEPEAAMLPQTGNMGVAVRVSAERASVESSASIHDLTKPNPICRDPGDCGVYASWHLPCENCKRAAALRSAA